MTHKMYFQIASGIVALFFYSPAFAQQHAVGLYYPDFAAFQRMFGASGINTLASNEAVRRVIAAWDNISPEGRELLFTRKRSRPRCRRFRWTLVIQEFGCPCLTVF